MRVWGYLGVATCAALIGGCSPPQAAASKPDPSRHQSLGRYQFAGKREYGNGTEVYYVDTMKGRVCYALITNDGKPDSNRCTDSLAFMEGHQ